MRGIFARQMSIGDAIAWGATALNESDVRIANARADSTLLLRHVIGLELAELHAEWDRQLTTEQTQRFNAIIRERQSGRPIQYITGVQEFFGLPFRVTPAVLIPRPETEHLVEAAIARLKHLAAPRIADVGTGSGAIAVALAAALPKAEVVALDISEAALAVAQENAASNRVAGRIWFAESDLLGGVPGEVFDAVVSNPPYVAESERTSLPVEVREYEPAQALFAGPTGLEIFERLIQQARNHLEPGGWLLIEIGQGQRDAAARMLQGWHAIEFIPDLQCIPRVAAAQKR